MPKHPITLEDLARIKLVGDPQMSPNGARVLYTVKTVSVEKNKYFMHLWLADVPPLRSGGGQVGVPRQFTFGEVSDASPHWQPLVPAGSRDGEMIAFIRSKDKQTQIWLVAAQGGEARPLTKMPDGSISEIAWSPDGKSLAFSFRPTSADWT